MLLLLLYWYVCRSPIWSLPILSEGQLNVGMQSNAAIISTPELPPVGQVHTYAQPAPSITHTYSHARLGGHPLSFNALEEPLYRDVLCMHDVSLVPRAPPPLFQCACTPVYSIENWGGPGDEATMSMQTTVIEDTSFNQYCLSYRMRVFTY